MTESDLHKLEKRIADLEQRSDNYHEFFDRVKSLGARIAALEGGRDSDGIAINSLFTRMIVAEAAFAKQRAVNEALLKWKLRVIKHYDDGIIAALREALKP
jgi:hypothetical protein